MKLNVFLIFAIALLGAVAARADQNYIRALVGDAIVTEEQVNSLLDSAIMDRARGNSVISQSNLAVLRDDIYKSLINRQLVLQEFKNLEKKGAKLPDSVIDGIIRREIGDDRVQFAKKLQREGKTMEQYRQEKRDELIAGELVRQSVPDPIISPRQIEEYYREHTNDYRTPERVKLRPLFLKKSADDTNNTTHARAEDVLSILKKDGASFKEVARTYSDTPSGASEKSPDWVETSTQKQQIQDALGRIKPGEVTDVIDTPEGCFIMLLEARDALHVRGLNDPEDSPRREIETRLRQQEKQRRVEAWFKRLEGRIFMKQIL